MLAMYYYTNLVKDPQPLGGQHDAKFLLKQGWLKGGVFLKPPLESKIHENPYN